MTSGFGQEMNALLQLDIPNLLCLDMNMAMMKFLVFNFC